MEPMKMALCRLCAEVKASSELWNLDYDKQKYHEVVAKLNLLNANDILDFSIHKRLPKVICLKCDEALNHVQEFLATIQKAQDVLAVLSAKSYKDHKDEWKPAFELQARNEFIKTEQTNCPLIEIKTEPENLDYLSTENFDLDNTDQLMTTDIRITNIQTEWATEKLKESNNTDNHTVTTENLKYDLTDIQKSLNSNMESNLTTEKLHEITDMEKHLNSTQMQMCLKNLESKLETFSSNTKEPIHQFEKAFDFPLLRDLIQTPLNKEKVYINKKKAPKSKDRINRAKKGSKNKKNAYPWQCSNCEVKFLTMEELQTHCKNEHGLEPPRKRRKRNSTVTEEELTCKICNKKYKNLQCIWAHNFRAHGKDSGGLYQFTCEQCGKTYNKKGSLKSHLMRHREKIHVCPICDQAFIFPNQLRHHIKHHSGVKPFACTQCDKRFASKKHLARHGFVHTDLRPFACKECSTTFRTKNSLRDHMSIHTGARAYTCELCGMSFSCWGNCDKHMKRIHNATMAKRKRTANGVIPLDPTTGEMNKLNVEALEEWKTQMLLAPPPPTPTTGQEKLNVTCPPT